MSFKDDIGGPDELIESITKLLTMSERVNTIVSDIDENTPEQSAQETLDMTLALLSELVNSGIGKEILGDKIVGVIAATSALTYSSAMSMILSENPALGVILMKEAGESLRSAFFIAAMSAAAAAAWDVHTRGGTEMEGEPS